VKWRRLKDAPAYWSGPFMIIKIDYPEIAPEMGSCETWCLMHDGADLGEFATLAEAKARAEDRFTIPWRHIRWAIITLETWLLAGAMIWDPTLMIEAVWCWPVALVAASIEAGHMTELAGEEEGAMTL
jgi:hypothetical protein